MKVNCCLIVREYNTGEREYFNSLQRCFYGEPRKATLYSGKDDAETAILYYELRGKNTAKILAVEAVLKIKT